MKVRAKFYIQTIERQGHTIRVNEMGAYDETGSPKRITTGIKVNMAPVYAPKDAKCENAKFWEATPSGQLWMQINNPEVFDQFNEGQEYYLTFEKA